MVRKRKYAGLTHLYAGTSRLFAGQAKKSEYRTVINTYSCAERTA